MKYKVRMLLFLVMLTGQVRAQEWAILNVRRGFVTTGVHYQMWRIEGYNNPITQTSFPISILLPMGRKFNLTITHTPALSRWYADTRIGGLSDTWIQGTYVFLGEKAMINVGLGAPTGKTRLNNNEFLLSNWLSLNVFRFRLPLYGQGLCGKAGFAWAYPFYENVILGFGAQYIHKRPYVPVEYVYTVAGEDKISDKEYKPGDEVIGNVGVDFRINEDMKIMLDGLYTYYWRDLLNSQEVYGAGQKVSMNIGFLYRLDRNYIWSRLTYRHRGKNELLQGLTFEKEEQNTNGPQLELDVVVKALDFEGSGIFFYGDLRLYGENERDDTGKAFVFGGGFGATLRVSGNAIMDFRFKYLGGSITTIETRSVECVDTFLGLKIDL